MPGAPRRVAVEIEQRREARRLAADDGERQRQSERAGAHHRLRRAADGDPDRQLLLVGTRIDAAVVDRRAQAARPADRFAVAQLEQQVELFGKQRVVVAEIVAEQRERFDEGAAPRHDLGAPARQQVERRELLEHADRIVRREHRHRAGQLDLLGAFGGRGKNHRRRRGGVVGAVMLAEAEHVEADLVGKLDLFDQVAQPLMRADVAGAFFRADVGEGVETEFHIDILVGERFAAGRGSGLRCAARQSRPGEQCISDLLHRGLALALACIFSTPVMASGRLNLAARRVCKRRDMTAREWIC